MDVDPAAYGELWADVYDEATAHLADDATAAVRFLTERLRPGARVLELGVGTGRIAIPLAASDVTVTGVDASPRMLEVMHAKPGGRDVIHILGDMVDPPVEGPFDAVLIAFNTLFSLVDQDAQVACVQRAASMLAPEGELIIDAAVPHPHLSGQDLMADGLRVAQVVLETADHDPVGQTVSSARVMIAGGLGIRTLPLRIRYASPSEIDLMCRLAGLVRQVRMADWDGAPVDRTSTRHITVYRRSATWN